LDVDIGAAQRRQLTPAKAGEGGEQHQGAVTLIGDGGQGVDLGHRQDRPFGGLLLTGPLDPTRIATDQPVVHRSVENRLEQPVRLGDGHLSDPGIEEILPPAPHTGLTDLGQRPGTEGRDEVTAQQVPVQLDRLRPQARPLLDPV
jgi:hypothetical protein